jgi:hypothetical protein
MAPNQDLESIYGLPQVGKDSELASLVFYAESFELKNTYRGLQISWGPG